VIAARFHTTLRDSVVNVCTCLKRQAGVDRVVLSGGIFMNLLLAESVEQELTARGFVALRHRRVPPNDGGLSVRQLAIAAAQLKEGQVNL
jgi:hydrogenase maturation protein HypF